MFIFSALQSELLASGLLSFAAPIFYDFFILARFVYENPGSSVHDCYFNELLNGRGCGAIE